MPLEMVQEGLQERVLSQEAELAGQRELLVDKESGQGRAWRVGRSVWLDWKVWVGGDTGGRCLEHWAEAAALRWWPVHEVLKLP